MGTRAFHDGTAEPRPVVSEGGSHSGSTERPIGSFGRTVIRVEHDRERPYVMIAKSTLSDRDLSFEQRGLLAFLLTKPDDWRVRPEHLAEESGVSRATIYRLLQGLRKAGYVRREDVVSRKPDGTFSSMSFYLVFERPEQPEQASIPRSNFDDADVPF